MLENELKKELKKWDKEFYVHDVIIITLFHCLPYQHKDI